MDVCLFPKGLFVLPASVNQDRQIRRPVRRCLGIVQDRNSFSERETVKAITAVFASEGASQQNGQERGLEEVLSGRGTDFDVAARWTTPMRHLMK